MITKAKFQKRSTDQHGSSQKPQITARFMLDRHLFARLSGGAKRTLAPGSAIGHAQNRIALKKAATDRLRYRG